MCVACTVTRQPPPPPREHTKQVVTQSKSSHKTSRHTSTTFVTHRSCGWASLSLLPLAQDYAVVRGDSPPMTPHGICFDMHAWVWGRKWLFARLMDARKQADRSVGVMRDKACLQRGKLVDRQPPRDNHSQSFGQARRRATFVWGAFVCVSAGDWGRLGEYSSSGKSFCFCYREHMMTAMNCGIERQSLSFCTRKISIRWTAINSKCCLYNTRYHLAFCSANLFIIYHCKMSWFSGRNRMVCAPKQA